MGEPFGAIQNRRGARSQKEKQLMEAAQEHSVLLLVFSGDTAIL